MAYDPPAGNLASKMLYEGLSLAALSSTKRSKKSWILINLLLLVREFAATKAFALPVSTRSYFDKSHLLWRNTDSTVLCAKSKQGTNKTIKKVKNGAGFGAKNKPSTKALKFQEDNYSVFPPLELSLMDTLLPSTKRYGDQVGPLPLEIYDRLDQIHGFRHFNYEARLPPQIDMAESLQQSNSVVSDFLLPTSFPANNELMNEEVIIEQSVSRQLGQAISMLPHFTEFRLLHIDPMIIAIDNFFTVEECDRYIDLASDELVETLNDAPLMSQSMTVGKDALAKAQRTSTTWFHSFRSVPELVAKGSRLLGLDDISHWEEPQTVRYRPSEKFTWHLDALAPSSDKGGAGQRTATLLVYLTDMSDKDGGATIFRDLTSHTGEMPLKIRPKKGSACLFFPAAGGIPNVPFDIRTLHGGEIIAPDAVGEKWIAQMWLREARYTPTAPPGNSHDKALEAIAAYCSKSS